MKQAKWLIFNTLKDRTESIVFNAILTKKNKYLAIEFSLSYLRPDCLLIFQFPGLFVIVDGNNKR